MAMGGKKNKSTRGQPLPSSSSLPPPLSPPPPPLPHYKIRAVIVALLRGERGENHSDNMLECSSGQIWWHCGCARVGSDIYNRPPAPASPADILEDHSLECGQQSERIGRHDSLSDVLFQAARQAGLAPVREERNLLAAQEDRV